MNFNSFEQGYNKNEVSWQKSISEISKFIVDHLDNRSDFFDFLNGEIQDKEKSIRWESRLEYLLDKITKRMGYHIDQNKLFLEAYEQIKKQYYDGELPISKGLTYFCDNIDILAGKKQASESNQKV